MQIIFPPSKQIKYLAMTSKNASASPFKGFQGSLCVNINLKRKNINVFVTAFVNFRKPTLTPQSGEMYCGVSYFWGVGGGSIIRRWPKETLWLKSPKHLDTLLANIFGYFECLKYLLIMFMKNWNVSPSRPYFLSCYIYHDRRPTRGDRVWIMGHTIAMKIHENAFIPAVGIIDYY